MGVQAEQAQRVGRLQAEQPTGRLQTFPNSEILTGGEGLQMVQSSKLESHIISQNATWSPTASMAMAFSRQPCA